MTDKAVQELLDKQAIHEVLLSYALAIDTQDESRLRSLFHPDSEHHHGFIGPSSAPDEPSTPEEPGDFVSFALYYLKGFSASHHHLGTPLITINGAHATSECYFSAVQIMRPKSDPLAAATAEETAMEISIGGRYIDEFEKRAGVWKIRKRTGVMDWQRVLPATV